MKNKEAPILQSLIYAVVGKTIWVVGKENTKETECTDLVGMTLGRVSTH